MRCEHEYEAECSGREDNMGKVPEGREVGHSWGSGSRVQRLRGSKPRPAQEELGSRWPWEAIERDGSGKVYDLVCISKTHQ